MAKRDAADSSGRIREHHQIDRAKEQLAGGMVHTYARVSGNYLLETLTLAPQGLSKTAQGKALGTVRAKRNDAL